MNFLPQSYKNVSPHTYPSINSHGLRHKQVALTQAILPVKTQTSALTRAILPGKTALFACSERAVLPGRIARVRALICVLTGRIARVKALVCVLTRKITLIKTYASLFLRFLTLSSQKNTHNTFFILKSSFSSICLIINLILSKASNASSFSNLT